jgi:hypothetical protein
MAGVRSLGMAVAKRLEGVKRDGRRWAGPQVLVDGEHALGVETIDHTVSHAADVLRV